MISCSLQVILTWSWPGCWLKHDSRSLLVLGKANFLLSIIIKLNIFCIAVFPIFNSDVSILGIFLTSMQVGLDGFYSLCWVYSFALSPHFSTILSLYLSISYY